MRTFVASKLFRAVITDANIDYRGSITISQNLLDASGIKPHELVHINNFRNAAHWETHVIPTEMNNVITLNGPPSLLFAIGDEVVIFNTISLTQGEKYIHRTVYIGESNSVKSIREESIEG